MIQRPWVIMKHVYVRLKRKSKLMEREPAFIKVSKFNRAMLIGCFGLICYNAYKLRQLVFDTATMNSKFVTQEIAVKANTKQLLDFMNTWNATQQSISDWMQQQREIQDKVSQDNPKLKIPKSAPVPTTLPHPQIEYSPEPRPTPIIIERIKKIYIRPKKKPSLLDELFKKRKDPKRTR